MNRLTICLVVCIADPSLYWLFLNRSGKAQWTGTAAKPEAINKVFALGSVTEALPELVQPLIMKHLKPESWFWLFYALHGLAQQFVVEKKWISNLPLSAVIVTTLTESLDFPLLEGTKL